MISLVYITSRVNPFFEWFLDSLDFQTTPEDKSNLEIIFVDRLIWDENAPKDIKEMNIFTDYQNQERKQYLSDKVRGRFDFKHVGPKPSVWQGPWRTTSEDWFAASNVRNTGLICSRGDFIVFVDDLSVLTGQWFKAVKEASQSGKVTCGAYRKVKELSVDKGNISYFVHHPQGVDNRFAYGNDNGPIVCSGNWLYGCSFACPTEFLLDVNGSDEACDGLGFEDCILGIRMGNRGYHFQYDRRMLSYESEEHHFIDKVMRRTDKGVSPNDKSHAVLNRASGTNRADNSWLGEGGVRAMRDKVLATGIVPVMIEPQQDWWDGQMIKEME